MCDLLLKALGLDYRQMPDDVLSFPYYAYRLNIPKQQNGYDCGVFILEYALRFLHDPISLVRY